MAMAWQVSSHGSMAMAWQVRLLGSMAIVALMVSDGY